MTNGLNPWVDAMLGHLLTWQLANGAALKACDPQNWVSVDAVPDALCPPCEPRLNPLEFHGRRRVSAVPQAADSASGSGARGSIRRRTRM